MRTARLRFSRERRVLTGDARSPGEALRRSKTRLPAGVRALRRRRGGGAALTQKHEAAAWTAWILLQHVNALRERAESGKTPLQQLGRDAFLIQRKTRRLMNAPRAHRHSAQKRGNAARCSAQTLRRPREFTPDDPLPPARCVSRGRGGRSGGRSGGGVILTEAGRAAGSVGARGEGGGGGRVRSGSASPSTSLSDRPSDVRGVPSPPHRREGGLPGFEGAPDGRGASRIPASGAPVHPGPSSDAQPDPPCRSPARPLLSSEFRTDGFPGGSLLLGHVVTLRRHRPGFPLRTAPQQGHNSRDEFRGGAGRRSRGLDQEKPFPSAPGVNPSSQTVKTTQHENRL